MIGWILAPYQAAQSRSGFVVGFALLLHRMRAPATVVKRS